MSLLLFVLLVCGALMAMYLPASSQKQLDIMIPATKIEKLISGRSEVSAEALLGLVDEALNLIQ